MEKDEEGLNGLNYRTTVHQRNVTQRQAHSISVLGGGASDKQALTQSERKRIEPMIKQM